MEEQEWLRAYGAVPWSGKIPGEERFVAWSTPKAVWSAGAGGRQMLVTMRWDPAEPHDVHLVVGDVTRAESAGWVFPRQLLREGGGIGSVRIRELEHSVQIDIGIEAEHAQVTVSLRWLRDFLGETEAVMPLGKEPETFVGSEEEWAAAVAELGKGEG